MDGAVNASSPGQGTIRGVHNRINRLVGDIALVQFQSALTNFDLHGKSFD